MIEHQEVHKIKLEMQNIMQTAKYANTTEIILLLFSLYYLVSRTKYLPISNTMERICYYSALSADVKYIQFSRNFVYEHAMLRATPEKVSRIR